MPAGSFYSDPKYPSTGITTYNPRLQKGLDPESKAVRVINLAKSMVHEVGVIAHACGVGTPRQLQRRYVRIMTANGTSIPLNELYPWRQPQPHVVRDEAGNR